jgi:His-Xaa-Ser system protein HxsD
MLQEIVVEFDAATCSLAALNAGAYRLIGTATCEIEHRSGRYVCRLTPTMQTDNRQGVGPDDLRTHFLNLVTDENLRERLAAKTEPVRNLILSLAFGSLAAQRDDQT